MRRRAFALFLASVLPGCMSYDAGPETGGFRPNGFSKAYSPVGVPGVVGTNGSAVPMAAPYASTKPASAWQANNMMAQSVPLNMVQFSPATQGGMNSPPGSMLPSVMAPGGNLMTPPGIPALPGMPPMGGMGGMPGMPGMPPMGGMPGMPPMGGMPGMPPMGMGGVQPTGGFMPPGQGGIMQAGGVGPMNAVRFNAQRTQVRFDRPAGMKVSWYTQGPDGQPTYSNVPIETPGRYNFSQGAIYRLKISGIEGRPGLEVYPTMEVVPSNPKSEAFLAHAAVPVSFTNDDFKQIAEGSFLIKVIYLPDRQFQEAGGAAIDEISSTRLDPGVDPVEEAARRGCILLIIRMGNVDQEAPNTPGLSQPSNQGPNGSPMMPMFAVPGHQVPYHMNFGPTHVPGVAGPVGAMPPGPLPPGILPQSQGPVAAPVPGIPTSRPNKGSVTITDDGGRVPGMPMLPSSAPSGLPPMPNTAPMPTSPMPVSPTSAVPDNGLPMLPPVSSAPMSAPMLSNMPAGLPPVTAVPMMDPSPAAAIPVSTPMISTVPVAQPQAPLTPPMVSTMTPPPFATPNTPPAVPAVQAPPMPTPAFSSGDPSQRMPQIVPGMPPVQRSNNFGVREITPPTPPAPLSNVPSSPVVPTGGAFVNPAPGGLPPLPSMPLGVNER